MEWNDHGQQIRSILGGWKAGFRNPSLIFGFYRLLYFFATGFRLPKKGLGLIRHGRKGSSRIIQKLIATEKFWKNDQIWAYFTDFGEQYW